MSKYTLGLAIIVKNEEKNLPVLWASVKNVVDEWIVVDTGSTDDTVRVAKKLGATVYEKGDEFCDTLTKGHVEFFKGYGEEVKEGEKVFHFGRARTFSFTQVKSDFILWLDADDILINSQKFRQILDDNLDPKRQHGLHMLYKYEVDKYQNPVVEHYRERVFPNNGTFKWQGRIHEIIIPTLQTQYLQINPDDSHVLHNVEFSGRKKEAVSRNTKNLLLDLYEQKKKDPRTLFYLAESLFFDFARHDTCLKLYDQYLDLSGWDEERHQACSRVVDIYLKRKDYGNALDWAFRSIKECPGFPSGYSNVAQCYFAQEDYLECTIFCDQALTVTQPDTMTLVNRKHNEVTPLMLKAASYFKLGKIVEAGKIAKEALALEPLHDYMLRIHGTAQRGIAEEKVASAFKLVRAYLEDEGELAKAMDLFKALPASHEEDPRMLGLQKKSEEVLISALQNPKVEDTSISLGELHQELPHVAYVEKELKSRGGKSILLLSSENNSIVSEWLTSKGFEVDSKAVKDKYDAVVCLNLLDKVYNVDRIIDAMMQNCKETGICIISTDRDDQAEGIVRKWSINSLRNYLTRKKTTIWTCIPMPGDSIYCSFLPGISTAQKPSIGFVCGESVEEWGPLSIHSGIGGSEEATIYITKELSRLGHQVSVYNNNPHGCTYEGVHWKHNSQLNESQELDVAILWRMPALLNEYNINAKKIYLWLHDIPESYWFTPDKLARIDKIIVLSEFHRNLLPNIPDEKFLISRNGVSIEQFVGKNIPKNPNKIIYTSSYDRGLENLLNIWPDVKKECPEAEFHICYGWGSFDKLRKHVFQREWKSKMMQLMKQPGIVEHGRIGQLEVAEQMLNSGIYAYPCHFEEISCISVMKSQVAGCVPLTTDYAALAETNLQEKYKVSGKGNDEIVIQRFKQKLIELLKNPVDNEERKRIVSEAIQKFSWTNVANQWSKNIGEMKS